HLLTEIGRDGSEPRFEAFRGEREHGVLHFLERAGQVLRSFGSESVPEPETESRTDHHHTSPIGAGPDLLLDDDAIVRVACQTHRPTTARYTSCLHGRFGSAPPSTGFLSARLGTGRARGADRR